MRKKLIEFLKRSSHTFCKKPHPKLCNKCNFLMSIGFLEKNQPGKFKFQCCTLPIMYHLNCYVKKIVPFEITDIEIDEKHNVWLYSDDWKVSLENIDRFIFFDKKKGGF